MATRRVRSRHCEDIILWLTCSGQSSDMPPITAANKTVSTFIRRGPSIATKGRFVPEITCSDSNSLSGRAGFGQVAKLAR